MAEGLQTIEHLSTDSLRVCDSPLLLSDEFEPIRRKKNGTFLATLNRFFACRLVILGLLKLNIKARQDTSEFLTTNLLLIHIIELDIDWSCTFLLAHFLHAH